MSMPRKICCAVEAVRDHGAGVYTVDLAPAMPAPAFRPGQFLHLTVDPYDPSGFWPDSRVFSIAGSTPRRDRIRICYAVKGRYTRKMAAALRPGVAAWIKLPYGEFVIDPGADAVLLAGGTGITAFTAFIEGLPARLAHGVTLVYGARTPELLLFRDLIRTQAAQVPGFRALFFAEGGAVGHADGICAAGRLSVDAIWSRLPAPADKVYYLSGPPAMLAALGAGLAQRGVPPDRIRTDAWE
jgi:ferredoxin-NADP reductase